MTNMLHTFKKRRRGILRREGKNDSVIGIDPSLNDIRTCISSTVRQRKPFTVQRRLQILQHVGLGTVVLDKVDWKLSCVVGVWWQVGIINCVVFSESKNSNSNIALNIKQRNIATD